MIITYPRSLEGVLRGWPSNLDADERVMLTSSGARVLSTRRALRWVAGSGPACAPRGRSRTQVGAPSLAAVDALLEHYALVAHPQTLETMCGTLLEGGWLPVIAAVSPSGELHVVGQADPRLTRKILSRALHLAMRSS